MSLNNIDHAKTKLLFIMLKLDKKRKMPERLMDGNGDSLTLLKHSSFFVTLIVII